MSNISSVFADDSGCGCCGDAAADSASAAADDRRGPGGPVPLRGHVPEVSLTDGLGDDVEVIVVPLFAGDDGLEMACTGLWDADSDVAVWQSFTAVGATGSPSEITTIAAPESTGVPAVMGVGLGDADDVDDEVVRRAAGTAARALRGFHAAATTLGAFGLGAAVEGFILGGYEFSGHRAASTKPTAKNPVARIDVVRVSADDQLDADEINTLTGGDVAGTTLSVDEMKALAGDEFTAAVTRAQAVIFARDLVNTPPLELYPDSYARAVETIAKDHGVEVDVFDEKYLADNGYGGIIAVGQGSSRPPRLMRLTYTPDDFSSSVALVGKGITFDTGGISLKPGKGMSDMTCDMAGSAAVVAAIIAAAQLKLGVKVTATVPLAENMPGGRAQRPGDVIRHYGGLTSEVLNTDAEGRLVLADAIARACEDNPDYLIETATLTGAQMSALGLRTAGAMGSEEFRDRVAALGRAVGETTWAMPIPEEVREDVTGSDIADVRNIATSPYGGMQAAGAYLEAAITGDVQWVHLDVAGPAWNGAKTYGYTPTRGTGCPVRTILATLGDIAANG